jgi:hypothetical protein
MGKTVSQLQYFEFLIALFSNIQLFWYIAVGKYFPASQMSLVLSSSGVQQLTNIDCSWLIGPSIPYGLWLSYLKWTPVLNTQSSLRIHWRAAVQNTNGQMNL